jgi:hypothetical protein
LDCVSGSDCWYLLIQSGCDGCASGSGLVITARDTAVRELEKERSMRERTVEALANERKSRSISTPTTTATTTTATPSSASGTAIYLSISLSTIAVGSSLAR